MSKFFCAAMKIIALLGFLLTFSLALPAQMNDTLSTPVPSPEARALFRYLSSIKGKEILSGQMDSNWGIDEIKYITGITGKKPAILGLDFINEKENEAEASKAIEWWKAGGIPTIMWHWGAPGTGNGYNNSKNQIDINKCFEEGTPEHTAF